MASRRQEPEQSDLELVPPARKRRPPAMTPAARENQLIALAYDAVEKKIRSGNASSQELTHFLKLGSTREQLEQERLMREVDLLVKKAEGMESASRIEALYEDAIAAMRDYDGTSAPPAQLEG